MFLNVMARLEVRHDELLECLRIKLDVSSSNENRRAQPQSSQVGGARGPSTSQTGVRRPEDVSPSSHHAVEVSSVRSAQSGRTSVWVSGGEDNSSQSSGNALVDAASVVGPGHESVRQCSQYELSGPGMSQMITGGMPSGVPPSVCLPADATQQQFANRSPVMILGGMPLGIPPSVCLPADAMCQHYVDSHMMKSQLATTDSRQYSPDLFTPVAIPSSSQNELTFSNVRGVNNSDVGRTVVDQFPGNSQSQQSRGGQAAEPRPPRSSNETQHASFNNATRALVYDAEATNGEANVAATDEKREKKANGSRKKSAKKRSADRSAKHSRSRPGHKKSDSDSESQSCDDDGKGRKGQSTSGTRPRHSRSKRRRASRSRSTSSRRASSSTASQKRKPDSNKTESETSSEGSSTESDSDDSMMLRSKHVLKPPKFDGKTSFESFWAQFQNCATHNKWTRPMQLVYLKNALEKDAANVLWDYGTEVTDSLSRLTRTLKMRFGGENFAEKNRIELRNRRRSPTETLIDLHIDIRRLSALAYPNTDHKTRELISCDYFIDALADQELGLKIRERQPKDLDAALHIALQLEV